jgi:hypothetical protein
LIERHHRTRQPILSVLEPTATRETPSTIATSGSQICDREKDTAMQITIAGNTIASDRTSILYIESLRRDGSHRFAFNLERAQRPRQTGEQWAWAERTAKGCWFGRIGLALGLPAIEFALDIGPVQRL